MRFIFTHPTHKPLIVDIPGCTKDTEGLWKLIAQMTDWNVTITDILSAPTI